MGKWLMPSDWWRLYWRLASMAVEAQTVIAIRSMGMAGFLRLAPGEHQRMVMEKAEAVRDSSLAGAAALMRGAGPAQASLAALAPISRRTRANAKRLSRPGGVGEPRRK